MYQNENEKSINELMTIINKTTADNNSNRRP